MRKPSRTKSFFLYLILLLVILLVNQVAEANQITIYPDQSIVKKRTHLQKIEILSKEKDATQAFNEYLASLDIKGVLEVAAELAEEDALVEGGIMVAPHLEKQYEAGVVPLDQLCNIIENPEYDQVFRCFVLDSIIRAETIKGYKIDSVITSLLNIAQNPDEQWAIRRYALLNLLEPGSYAMPGTSKESSILEKIFKDESVPPEVRAASITAMSRTEDPNFKSTIDSVLNNYTAFAGPIIQNAAIATAKTSKEYSNILGEIIEKTEDPEVYASTVFALGIIGNIEAVESIVGNYGRLEGTVSCNSALAKNEKTILEMLAPSQEDNIILSGTEAARLISLPSAIEPLQVISVNSTNTEIRDCSKRAIEEIQATLMEDSEVIE